MLTKPRLGLTLLLLGTLLNIVLGIALLFTADYWFIWLGLIILVDSVLFGVHIRQVYRKKRQDQRVNTGVLEAPNNQKNGQVVQRSTAWRLLGLAIGLVLEFICVLILYAVFKPSGIVTVGISILIVLPITLFLIFYGEKFFSSYKQ